jgi:SAM-dependent methyltransferase
MLLSLLHNLVARPSVYNAVQVLAGAHSVRQRLAAELADCQPQGSIIDLGGGTGAIRSYLRADAQYVCLDLELPKLSGFRARYPAGNAVLGSAVPAPFRNDCADIVLACAVCHHLTDNELDQLFREAKRILKPTGRFVMLDPVIDAKSVTRRALWALDRGAYPRTAEALVDALARHVRIVRRSRYAVLHEYIIAVGSK